MTRQDRGAFSWNAWKCKFLSIDCDFFFFKFLICFYLLICSKDVRLPGQLQRAMAAEAEAAREARAKVIAAEGEMKASIALKEASEVMEQSPAALQLRYLQTLHSIAAEKNSTIIFPLPMEIMRGFAGASSK